MATFLSSSENGPSLRDAGGTYTESDVEEAEDGSEVTSSDSPAQGDASAGCSIEAYDEAGLSVISTSSSP